MHCIDIDYALHRCLLSTMHCINGTWSFWHLLQDGTFLHFCCQFQAFFKPKLHFWCESKIFCAKYVTMKTRYKKKGDIFLIQGSKKRAKFLADLRMQGAAKSTCNFAFFNAHLSGKLKSWVVGNYHTKYPMHSFRQQSEPVS